MGCRTGKTDAPGFDQSICDGCPHRVRGDENTGRTAIDAAALGETKVLEAITGEKQYKCGLCGCPLKNLELFGKVPTNCPRLREHGGDL